jgi:hypothetical protein
VLLVADLSGVYETDGMIYGWRVTALSPSLSSAPLVQTDVPPGAAAPQGVLCISALLGSLLVLLTATPS